VEVVVVLAVLEVNIGSLLVNQALYYLNLLPALSVIVIFEIGFHFMPCVSLDTILQFVLSLVAGMTGAN
jgi:hypothetical protein